MSPTKKNPNPKAPVLKKRRGAKGLFPPGRPPMNRVAGRPPKFDGVIAEKILNLVRSCVPLEWVAQSCGIHAQTIRRWQKEDQQWEGPILDSSGKPTGKTRTKSFRSELSIAQGDQRSLLYRDVRIAASKGSLAAQKELLRISDPKRWQPEPTGPEILVTQTSDTGASQTVRYYLPQIAKEPEDGVYDPDEQAEEEESTPPPVAPKPARPKVASPWSKSRPKKNNDGPGY